MTERTELERVALADELWPEVSDDQPMPDHSRANALRRLAAAGEQKPAPQPAPGWDVTEDAVEIACKAYADAVGYYVQFHRGLSSDSANNIRQGMRAALKALRSSKSTSDAGGGVREQLAVALAENKALRSANTQLVLAERGRIEALSTPAAADSNASDWKEEESQCTCGAGHGSLEGHTDWCAWVDASDCEKQGDATKSEGGEPDAERTQRRLAVSDEGLGPMQAIPREPPSGPSDRPADVTVEELLAFILRYGDSWTNEAVAAHAIFNAFTVGRR